MELALNVCASLEEGVWGERRGGEKRLGDQVGGKARGKILG